MTAAASRFSALRQEVAALADGSASSEDLDELAQVIAAAVPLYLKPDRFPQYFKLWQAHGFHVTPNHFYYPVPDTSSLPDSVWEDSALPGIEMNEAAQLDLVTRVFPAFRDEYLAFSQAPTADPREFHLYNPLFDGVDALSFYCMVRHFRPRRIVEVGSGFSSRIASQAAVANGCTRLTCIEPYPDEVLRSGLPALDRLIETKVQDVDLRVFTELEAGDILFIDSSHVVKIGGDVTYLYLEVLPRLAPGVLVHVHDIFLPGQYLKEWVKDLILLWTEQYLLQAFLAFNSAFEVVLCNSFFGKDHGDTFREVFPNSRWASGASFWMRRRID